ncbi:HPGDS [Symbiodinium sp. CCMP2592]|nr:HPGDS [Symbiodinium sp. CCMP2592]
MEQCAAVCTGCNDQCAESGAGTAKASTELANIVARHRFRSRGAEELDVEFRQRFFHPVLRALQKCATPGGDSVEESDKIVEELAEEVTTAGLTNFGYVYARQAMQELGFRICDASQRPEWVVEARALARSQLEEWRIPGTENIVAVISYELHYSGDVLRREPTVVTSGWAEGVHDEVKAMLRPVDARGWSCESYSERVALLELIEAARCRFGDESVSELTGWVRMYHSHHTSVTGLGVFCQFRRHVPKVSLDLDFDGAWYTWAGNPRPLTLLSDEPSLQKVAQGVYPKPMESRLSSKTSTASGAGAYSLEVSHLRQSARSVKWDLPRLRDKHDERGVTKQEAFCWILYGSSLATIAMHFAKGQTLPRLLLALFTYWSLYAASAEYSTRFSADGSDHRVFYILLAMSIFFMDVNWTGDVLASGNPDARKLHLNGLAACYMLIGLMHARVGVWLPACRTFATFHLALNATSASLYLFAARSSEGLCQVLCWIACALFFPRTYGLPQHNLIDSITRQRNAKDYIGRSQTVMITTLALVVKCITKGVEPGQIHLGHNSFWTLMSSLLLVLLVKILLYDVHIADTKWHAVRCETSHLRPAAFLSLVPVAMAGVMMMAAGSFLVLDEEFKERRAATSASRKAGQSFCQGFGVLLLSVTTMRMLHNEPHVPAVSCNKRLMVMWKVQVGVQLLFAALSFSLSGRITGKEGLCLCVILTAILIVLNLLDELEELHSYRGNWKVVRTIGSLHGMTKYMKKGSQNSSDDRLESQDHEVKAERCKN